MNNISNERSDFSPYHDIYVIIYLVGIQETCNLN